MKDILSAAPNMKVTLQDTFNGYALNCITELDRIRLSPYDKLTMLRIIVGCCKNNRFDFRITTLKAEARKMVNLPNRTLVFLSIIALLLNQQNPRDIRICEVKRKLSSDEPINCDRTGFFRAFKRCVELNVLDPAESSKPKRGRRSPVGNDYNFSGPDSMYKESRTVRDIKRIISIPSARRLIYLLLLESGILFKDLFHMLIVCLYALKMGGPDIIKKLAKSSFLKEAKELEYIDKLYDSIKNLDDKNLIRKADKMSLQHLISLRLDNPTTYMSLISYGLKYYESSIF